MEAEDALRVLNLQAGASPTEVRAAYRQMLKDWHPDRFTGDARRLLEAEPRTRLIITAYRALSRAPSSGSMSPGRSDFEWFELPIWTQLNLFRRAGRPSYPYPYTVWDRFAIAGLVVVMLGLTLLSVIFDW
jgi:hypothetical protein